MTQLIATYLQDHHAGSSAGLAAFERVAAHHGDPEVRQAVAELAALVREDQESLEKVMEDLGASPSALKDAATWVGEKVARLKPNERLVSRSPLSDVEELETLVLGVHGKALLWRALIELDDPRLGAAELHALADRADAQESRLEALRRGQLAKLLQE